MPHPLRRIAFLVALSAAIATAAAQSPGSPEAYMRDGHESFAAGYWSGASTSFRQATMLQPENGEAHFMLAAALAKDGRWDEARTVFARALELRPDLGGDVDAWLAAAPAATPAPSTALPRPSAPPVPAPAPVAPSAPPAAPAAPAVPAAPGAPEPAPGADAQVFAVGDAVEVMYREGFWIPGVVTAADPGACPYYRVSADAYGRGDPSNLGYFCGSVRAPTGVAAPVAECGGSNTNCTPTAPPPLGDYVCSEQVWQGAGVSPAFRTVTHATLSLLPGGRYRLYDDGDVGGYRYDASTHALTWSGGELAGRGAEATYGLDGTSPEITIAFPTDFTRRTGNEPPTWQCGLDD